MKLIYLIPIVIGFSIDVICLGKWIIAYVKRKDMPSQPFGAISIFVLPAWGISELMIFGKQPQEILNTWNLFLTVLFIAFCIHLFICIVIPFLIAMICNLYYRRKLFDLSKLPNPK